MDGLGNFSDAFMKSAIVPIFKTKAGKSSNINNDSL